ncbi:MULTISPECIES: hypothetical protein [Pseudomonas]|uniref:hypothetical protein n=1 Tax=Pseudomonas TaxID=286 RepID=UPI001AEA620E|nr:MULTISPECIES: hypothetical protein [unclassified Pseudomonas]MBP1085377.1 putative RNase H-like nuclease (RuvC/YqgF family) [Pseudomonas sp. PvP007]MBP1193586.1 putative RNase H-like nuclease (RuvC/YqgF family) [Pseudomonas sp. PvP100]
MTRNASGIVKAAAQLIFGGAGVAALVTIAYTMWHDSTEKSAAFGKNEAALGFANGQLIETKTENEKLKVERANLQQQIDNLRQELLTEQINNKYDKKLLTESNLRTQQLETQVTQLGTSLRNSDPCAILRKDIGALEEELQRPSYSSASLNDLQRTQAQSSLEKKYNSLDVCQSSRR